MAQIKSAKFKYEASLVGERARVECECPGRIWGRVRYQGTFGAYSYANPESMLDENVKSIGRYTSIGNKAVLGPPEHRMDMLSLQAGLATNERTEIGHDVWIGSGATVLAGVRLGDGAVIGAGAVVTKNVPDYMIAAGVPAKPLRLRFSEPIVEQLVALRWWRFARHDIEDVLGLDPARAIATIREREAAGRLSVMTPPRALLAYRKAGPFDHLLRSRTRLARPIAAPLAHEASRAQEQGVTAGRSIGDQR